ncbi:MAG TPA: alpha-1,4-glucan--maltose-1-phosphate maltosyltransferase [Candidatus Binataceae bacterium]|nr:alpha-1,4-glucan--maltose-1-phosphate maltosyltransferase [Candidatus Binataceae bacterium]
MSSIDLSHLPPLAGNWRVGHIIIEDVTPSIDGGRYPVKRVVGEPCVVEADIFREGHQLLRASVRWRRKEDESFFEAPMESIGDDRWRGRFIPNENTRYVYAVEAWTDVFGSWLADFIKKAHAGRDLRSDLLEGIDYLGAIVRHANGADREIVESAIRKLQQNGHRDRALDILSDERLADIALRVSDRFGDVRSEPLLELVVDRPKARFSAWYEFFVRSQSNDPGRVGTFRDAEGRLPYVRDLGFDVLYLPPIHPIGRTNRKGPGNSLNGGSHAVGSPWAIGNEAGGHTAIDPGLGTLADFDRFVSAANRLGIEVALDFAIQTSPDHPWVREHPEWFSKRPDGSIKYAENPPKEYQDIYPVNFDTNDQRGLLQELFRVVDFWIGHGVHIFRVDNPHTKPIAFWEWLIARIQHQHPEVIFLAEAFTRPKLMKVLAKAGFTQSYTYFTWRNSKYELTEYMRELTESPVCDYLRPNFFTNTPDILPPILQSGSPAAFKLRLFLAATLSSSYGIYSGFELCESQAVPNTEEYMNSEKYELKVRDWNAPNNIKEFVARMNRIRRDNAALQQLVDLTFLDTDNDQILFYAKTSADMTNVLLMPVNLDPVNVQICTAVVPPALSASTRYRVRDLLTGATYDWSERNYVRLDPAQQPGHILRIEQRL